MKVHAPSMCRGFESHLAPHIALFQGLVSESEPFRKVHAPFRVMVVTTAYHLVWISSRINTYITDGIGKVLEFSCEDADLMP